MLITRNPTAAMLAILVAALGFAIQATAADAFEITSAVVTPGATIPPENTCTGADSSPPLGWSGAPAGTKSFALIVADPDAPSGVFYHWIAYNIPASSTGFPAKVARTAEISEGGTQGVNSFGTLGYKGPCPPHGKPHHYHFRLFALGIKLDLHAGANAQELEAAMQGHTLATAALVGTFQR